MKKTIWFFGSTFLMALVLFSSSCKKSNDAASGTTNTAVIKLNGAQPAIDSVTANTFGTNGAIYAINIWVHIHSTSASSLKIGLKFLPSDPLYAAGSVINLASSQAIGLTYLSPNNSAYGDPYMDPEIPGHLIGGNGTVTITKNDFNNRRIEGTVANCVATNPANTNDQVTVEGNFAVTYPAP